MKKGTLLKLGLPPFPKTAGTAKEFRDWDLKLKREYPVRYKIWKFLKSVHRRLIKFPIWRLRDAYWSLQYHINPKHKYTTIKLKRLKPGYYDTDKLIFYTMFELFEEFMLHQLTNPNHVWEYTEDCYEEWWDPQELKEDMDRRNAIWKEMKEIYDWWINIYPNRQQTLPKIPTLPKEWGILAPFNEDFKNEEETKEWKRVVDERNDKYEQWKEEDQQMMIRLIKIKDVLWD